MLDFVRISRRKRKNRIVHKRGRIGHGLSIISMSKSFLWLVLVFKNKIQCTYYMYTTHAPFYQPAIAIPTTTLVSKI